MKGYIASPRDLPEPGIEPTSPPRAGGFWVTGHQGSPSRDTEGSTEEGIGAGGRRQQAKGALEAPRPSRFRPRPAVAGDGPHVQVVVREGVDPRTQPLVLVLVHGVADVHDGRRHLRDMEQASGWLRCSGSAGCRRSPLIGSGPPPFLKQLPAPCKREVQAVGGGPSCCEATPPQKDTPGRPPRVHGQETSVPP